MLPGNRRLRSRWSWAVSCSPTILAEIIAARPEKTERHAHDLAGLHRSISGSRRLSSPRQQAAVACHWYVSMHRREVWPGGGGRNMTLTGLIIFLLIGAVAGWIAGQIMSGGGFGLVGNIVVGVIGALIGGWVFSLLGIAVYGLIGSIIAAVIGAVILLALLMLILPV